MQEIKMSFEDLKELEKHPQEVGLKYINQRANPRYTEDPERVCRNKCGNWVVKYEDGSFGIEDTFGGFWK